MIREIVQQLNESIESILPADQKVYGIAQSISRNINDKVQVLPGVVGKGGEIKYVGIDDDYRLITYHKMLSCNTTVEAGSGFGDDLPDLRNTYGMCLVAFWNMQRLPVLHDEMLMVIQARIPRYLENKATTKRIVVTYASSILNSLTVFATEYRSENMWLPENKNLLLVNYNIETIFNPGCVSKCFP